MELMRVKREDMREMKRLRSWKMIMKIVQIKLFDTYNTGGLDGKDTGMMFRAWVVIPTAADQHQATPA